MSDGIPKITWGEGKTKEEIERITSNFLSSLLARPDDPGRRWVLMNAQLERQLIIALLSAHCSEQETLEE